jgi:hypothetical protein
MEVTVKTLRRIYLDTLVKEEVALCLTSRYNWP